MPLRQSIVAAGLCGLLASPVCGMDALALLQEVQDASEPESSASPTAEAAPRIGVTISAGAWLTNIDGDFTVKGNSFSASPSFEDIRDNSDRLLGGDFRIGLEVGRFLAYFEAFLVRIDVNDIQTPSTPPLDAKQSLDLVEFGVGWTFIETELGKTPVGARRERRLTLAGVVGGRWFDTGLRLEDSATGSELANGSQSWFEPLMGLEGRAQLLDWLHVAAFGDVGGVLFGSELSWTAFGGVGFDLPVGDADLSLLVGYKALYADYHDGSGADAFKWDATMSGPWIGMQIAF